MKKVLKRVVSLMLAALFVFLPFVISNQNNLEATAAERYPAISAIKIPRIAQTDHKSCNLCSQASVEAYIQGTYAGINFEYGTDYPMTTQLFVDMKSQNGGSVGWSSTLNKKYGYTRSTEFSLSTVYDLLREGKPVIIYVESATDNSSNHGSVIIGYNGSSTTLEESGFTVMEIHKENGKNSKELFDKYANNPEPADDNESCYVSLSSWRTGAVKHIIYPNKSFIYDSGKCGDNVTYTFNKTTGALVISGTGDMYSWGSDAWYNIPWSSYLNEIKSITIEEGVTNIGYAIFGGCENVENVTIADSVTNIRAHAFGECKKLEEIIIPSKIEVLEWGTFSECVSLKSITLPKSLKTIRSEVFYGCSSLYEVYYEGSEEEWNNVVIEALNNPLQNAKIYYNSSVYSQDIGLIEKISNWIESFWNSLIDPFYKFIEWISNL